MCNCTETRQVISKLVDWDLGEVEVVQELEYHCTEDIDTHRFRCTKCGEVGYYSGAARRFHEKGERSPGITGLG